jgi:hypothetical protein
VRWDAKLLAVVGHQVSELDLRKIDLVLGIERNLADSPVPDCRQVKEPARAFGLLGLGHAQFELVLNHDFLQPSTLSSRPCRNLQLLFALSLPGTLPATARLPTRSRLHFSL